MNMSHSPDNASSPEAPITSPPPEQLFQSAFPGLTTTPLTITSGLFSMSTDTNVSGVPNVLPSAPVAGIPQQQPFHTEQSTTLTQGRLKSEMIQEPPNKNGSMIQ